VVIVFLIAFLAASAVGVVLYFSLKQWYPNSPTMANVLLIFLSSVVLYFFLLAGTYFSVKVRHDGKLATLGLKSRGLGGGLLYGIGLGFPIFIGAVFLSYLTQEIFGPRNNYVSKSVTDVSSGYSVTLVVLLFITLVILAPLCEEIFFRGYLYPALRNRMDRQPAMLINGLLFAAAHFEWFGFLPRFLLGYGLCYIYEKQGNLSGPITGHALYNGIILLLALVRI
jgi:membrane protease YdiL (CAAX protease family)